MGFFLRFIISTIGILVGLLLIVKSYAVVHKIGRNNWAEEHLGGGGSYSLVKLIGMILIVISVLLILGVIKIF
ncbi:hypothetical protein C4544_04900 [candidate division WS5 bacterium]|uniref:DUF3784 domain-containing protein n=1 Tax=candidate division WS5 bacterium TaxID=2093353 RepID=A0A419DBP2_9BACT|nr:MAG: hypothetical protein C4544_04900 [candidate division WS5 bacterium]